MQPSWSSSKDFPKLFNPDNRQDSFCSPVQHSCCQIDFPPLDKVKSGSYGSTVISNHASLSMACSFPNKLFTPKLLCLISLRLFDHALTHFLATQITTFLDINCTSDTSPSTIWKTLKILQYVHGQIVSHLLISHLLLIGTQYSFCKQILRTVITSSLNPFGGVKTNLPHKQLFVYEVSCFDNT